MNIPTEFWLVLPLLVITTSAQDCQSPTYTFRKYHNASHKLDLTVGAHQVIATFSVTNTRSAVVLDSDYLAVKVQDGSLIFSTTEAFAEYEQREVDIRITASIQFQCADGGTLVGSYYQDLLEANNHEPEFSREVYEAMVPLPLPKNFDLSPYLDDGKGILAVDYDLVNNTVEFSAAENQYLRVESVRVPGDGKSFRGVLRLKDQILKLAEDIDLEIVAKDHGVPVRSSKARVVIKPDLSIEYNDPPMFKRTFFLEEYSPESEILITVELVPGTVHHDVKYSLEGEDDLYFKLNVDEDKSKAVVTLNKEPKPPKGKYFMSTVVTAMRSELQKAECVIVIDLKKPVPEDTTTTTVEKTFVILHLEEERDHPQVFPAKVGNCNYGVVSQVPRGTEEIFKVDEAGNWIAASKFDREDFELFRDLDQPQFHVVLQLVCPPAIRTRETSPSLLHDIPYSTDTTYLNVIVDDINDNVPIFTFPRENEVFAFPVPRISERLFPSQLLQVEAYDLDAGLNATIHFSVSPNGGFEVEPTSGVIYPLKTALQDENPIELEILATDRDGAEDGNVSKLKIRVVPALSYQLSVLELENVEHDQLDEYLRKLQADIQLRIQVIVEGYVTLPSDQGSRSSSRTVHKLVVAAFDGQNNLVTNEDFAKALQAFEDVKVSGMDNLPSSDEPFSEECSVYPYVVIMAVFIVLFVATCALSAYLWFKWYQLKLSSCSAIDPSIQSDDVLVESQYNNAGSTPPVNKRDLLGATVDYSSDSVSRSNRMIRSLSDLLSIDEAEESTGTESNSAEANPSEEPSRPKSIRFNEDVERIEVY